MPARHGTTLDDRPSGKAKRPGINLVQLVASACLAIALLALSGVATWSAFKTSAAAKASTDAGRLADAYNAARFDIGAEESLERKYRLEPGAEIRKQHLAAKTDLDAALALVSRDGDAADRAIAADVTGRNAIYLIATAQMFAAVDRGDPTAATTIDRNGVDPVFNVMQTIVYAQAAVHGADDAKADRRLLGIESLARWATSLAVGVGAVLILLFSRLRRQSTKAHGAQSDLNAYQATHDELTGLPNRGLFATLLEGALIDARESDGTVAVVLLDLDRFKDINDTLGHRYGDYLLQQIGPRIRAVLRDVDVLARLGGDEFVMLFPSRATGQEAIYGAMDLTRRILDALHEPFMVDDVSLAVEASAGIVVWPAHGDTGDLLLQHADIAMYLAKSRHEDVALYSSALDGHNPRKLTLLSQLRGAVDNGELTLHFQPLVNFGSGAVVGAEALVRWNHPDEGLLLPGEFVPLAEGSGFIHELTRFVLYAACEQAKVWEACGVPLVVSVNISARCLLDTALPQSVAATLVATGLPPHLLKLELTETAIIADPDRARSIIGRLHTLGVGLSVDDFGTGYTSLSSLRDLPVQEFKIDRSFVTNMVTNPKDAIIVRTGVELAHRLGLDSVAEGIEDAETYAALAALGCTTAQGFHLGRPMPSDDFDSWLADWSVAQEIARQAALAEQTLAPNR
ncbi:MAG TPA: EAL domain-containing protein [Acidothermaceae bacterium]|nr:EAL domain-containing protein [Acidothermaceae bacterium]